MTARRRIAEPSLLLALLLLAGCAALGGRADPAGPPYDDAAWARVLATCVADDGRVDYVALRRDAGEDLAAYLALARDRGPGRAPDDFAGESDVVAFYLNVSNALILARWLQGGAGEATDAKPAVANAGWYLVDRWTVDGTWLSQNDLVKRVIEPAAGDPRVHFALVGGTISAPPLRREPYRGATLDAQLEDQGRRWFAPGGGAMSIEVDGTARFSLVLMYAMEMLEPWGGVAGAVRRYVPEEDPRRAAALASLEAGTARWMPYLYEINDVRASRGQPPG